MPCDINYPIGLINFDDALKTDSEFQRLARQLKGKDYLDLQAMHNDGIEDPFDQLVTAASEYELEINDIIDALVRLGYVQGEFEKEEEKKGLQNQIQNN